MSLLAAKKDIKKGIVVDFLGDSLKSARSNLPVYYLTGGRGFVWAAGAGLDGRGHLRFAAGDFSRFDSKPTSEPIVAERPTTPSNASAQRADQSEPMHLKVAKSNQSLGKRVALVISIGEYQHLTKLQNPRNDAVLVAQTLTSLGFALVGGGPQTDLDETSFKRMIQNFGEEIHDADAALFYYAGHGIQIKGNNYLVPANAKLVRESDVDFHALDANLVLKQMEASGAQLNVIVLDACRNNPLPARGLRSGGGGLAHMQAPQGTLISFSTQPGNVALDGLDQKNSPFTTALVDSMKKPGLDIFRLFNEVGLAVSSATQGVQRPWLSSSPIKGEFHFNIGTKEAKADQPN